MGISEYVRGLREHIGTGLLLLPAVSAVVRNDRGDILMVKRADNGEWAAPAGGMEPGEQPADAVVREVLEETGVDVAIDRIIAVTMVEANYPDGNRCQFLSTWFVGRVVGGEARVNDDESTEVAWFAPDRLPEISAMTRKKVELARADRPEAWFAPAGQPAERFALGMSATGSGIGSPTGSD